MEGRTFGHKRRVDVEDILGADVLGAILLELGEAVADAAGRGARSAAA